LVVDHQRSYFPCLRCCTVAQASQTVLVRPRPLFGPQTVRRILLQLHPSAKTARTREATVHLVILYLKALVLIESQRFHSQGQGMVPPLFGWLQSQTRPCSASMFPSGNFEVTLRTSWVVCRGLPLKAEVAGGQATWLGISHATISARGATHYLSSTTNSTEQAHAVLHPSTYWVTH
jgi:hypothetical protein